MKLDRYNCLGGRFNDKNVLGIRLNGHKIFPYFEPGLHNSYTILIDEDMSDNDFNAYYPDGILFYIDNKKCVNNYNLITSWGDNTITTEYKHSYHKQDSYEILSYGFIKPYSMYTGVVSVNYIRPDIVNGSHLFDGYRYVTDNNLFLPETSYMTNMSYMFRYCRSLTSLNLKSFDTSKVTNMENMFSGCDNLQSLDLSGWDTSNVTNMSGIFSSCSNLKTLDLSGWNMSSIEYVSYDTFMFSGCTNLTKIWLKDCSYDTVRKINKDLWHIEESVGGTIYITSGSAAGLTAPKNWSFEIID